MTQSSDPICDPAATIIRLLGGDAETARICGVHRSQPGRWKRPAAGGGSGGVIPGRHHRAILGYSREHSIGIEPGDLVEVSPNVAARATALAKTAKAALDAQPEEAAELDPRFHGDARGEGRASASERPERTSSERGKADLPPAASPEQSEGMTRGASRT